MRLAPSVHLSSDGAGEEGTEASKGRKNGGRETASRAKSLSLGWEMKVKPAPSYDSSPPPPPRASWGRAAGRGLAGGCLQPHAAVGWRRPRRARRSLRAPLVMFVVWDAKASPSAKKTRAPSSRLATEPGQRAGTRHRLLQTTPRRCFPRSSLERARRSQTCQTEQPQARAPSACLEPALATRGRVRSHPAVEAEAHRRRPGPLASGAARQSRAHRLSPAHPSCPPSQQVASRRHGQRDRANTAAAALGAAALGARRGGQEKLEATWTTATPTPTRGGSPGAKRGCRAAGGELPIGLHCRRGQHGQFHGSDKEPGSVVVPLLGSEPAPGAEASHAAQQFGHLQRRQPCRVSADSHLAFPALPLESHNALTFFRPDSSGLGHHWQSSCSPSPRF